MAFWLKSFEVSLALAMALALAQAGRDMSHGAFSHRGGKFLPPLLTASGGGMTMLGHLLVVNGSQTHE